MTFDMQLWATADTLADLPTPILNQALHEPKALFLIFVQIAERRNLALAELPTRDLRRKLSNVYRILNVEIARRAIALDRAKLKFVGNLRIEELAEEHDLPEGEFLRALAMRFRERTGMEINEKDTVRLLIAQQMCF